VGRGELVASRASGEQARAAAHAHLQAAFAAYQRYYEQHQVRLDAKSAQELGQLQSFIAAFPQECVGHLASSGPTLTTLTAFAHQISHDSLSFLCLITPLCSYLYGGLYGGLYERAHIIRYFSP
jgi:hypothetical protein